MIYHLNFSYYEKKSKFQVKFHVFCKFEKKAWFIPILAARVGLKRTRNTRPNTNSDVYFKKIDDHHHREQ